MSRFLREAAFAWGDERMYMTVARLRGMAPELAGTDEALAALIEAAGQLIEAKLGRRLMLGDYTYRQLLPDGRILLLEAWPVQSVARVTADGEAVSDWTLDAGHGLLMLRCRAEALVECEYTGGLAEMPEPILQAIALTALAISRAAENGGQAVMSERLGDYQMMWYNQESRDGAAFTLSPAAEALIAPYKAR